MPAGTGGAVRMAADRYCTMTFKPASSCDSHRRISVTSTHVGDDAASWQSCPVGPRGGTFHAECLALRMHTHRIRKQLRFLRILLQSPVECEYLVHDWAIERAVYAALVAARNCCSTTAVCDVIGNMSLTNAASHPHSFAPSASNRVAAERRIPGFLSEVVLSANSLWRNTQVEDALHRALGHSHFLRQSLGTHDTAVQRDVLGHLKSRDERQRNLMVRWHGHESLPWSRQEIVQLLRRINNREASRFDLGRIVEPQRAIAIEGWLGEQSCIA